MSVTDYADYNEQGGSAVVLASTNLVGTGLAKEAGGHLQDTANSTFGMGNNLAGVTSGALISAAGLTVSKDMLHANTGVTTEIAALMATGSPSGAPGGVPLLTGRNLIDAKTGLNVTTAVQVFPTANTFYPITQIGYDGTITIGTLAGPVYLRVILQWFDGGVLIDNQTWYLAAGNTAGTQHSIYCKGPTQGSQLQVTLEMLSGSATVGFTLLQNSRVYDRHRWVTSAFGALAFTAVNQEMANGVIASQATGAIAANSDSASYLLPLWPGRCIVSILNNSGSDGGLIQISDPSPATGPNAVVVAATFPASQDTVFECILPRANCLAHLHNNGTASISPTFTIVADV